MWRWDQGHLPYFQFDALRQIAQFVVVNDFKDADRPTLIAATGLDFAAPATHSPWRNYSRVLKLCLLVSEHGGKAVPTPVAFALADPGKVVCDEYLHFLICAFTDPSPALSGYDPTQMPRYPLLFCLKYMLLKAALGAGRNTDMDELFGAYHSSALDGSEGEKQFASLVSKAVLNSAVGGGLSQDVRQPRESLRVISQLSYLHLSGSTVAVSLSREDAKSLFNSLNPIGAGIREAEREDELRRLAGLFKFGKTIPFEFSKSVVSDEVESGFVEGSKVKKTHIIIERNSRVRSAFFAANPTSVCDVCEVDTAKTYSWTSRVLDVHHILPLGSGNRTTAAGTMLADLKPVCPSCHRAVHRYYDNWLKAKSLPDFQSINQARDVYVEVKKKFSGIKYA